ncbi:hypothetical protein ZEAMMB73_Zm00001d021648 [Zea mays]|uniref:Uncharacterized protein n=1 Tax=Zea mays TaxID=4577 RepID=A0A1D6IDN8_MAIZE|nr:hypothetical protein ZEAMMB73_Zm00001d021648 [Zea mays]ONM57862.1 hypothetical protein ZEAMMB73_Zm00001d021648 [Zea mays]
MTVPNVSQAKSIPLPCFLNLLSCGLKFVSEKVMPSSSVVIMNYILPIGIQSLYSATPDKWIAGLDNFWNTTLLQKSFTEEKVSVCSLVSESESAAPRTSRISLNLHLQFHGSSQFLIILYF